MLPPQWRPVRRVKPTTRFWPVIEKTVMGLRDTIGETSALRSPPFAILPLTIPQNKSVQHNEVDEAIFPWPMVSLSSEETEKKPSSDGIDDNLQLATAVGLYNMGLACHRTFPVVQKPMDRDHLLKQAQLHYLQAYELSFYFNVPLLKLALFTNLMDVSLQRGNLLDLQAWALLFQAQAQELTGVYPDEVLQRIWNAHLFLSRGLYAARAA